MITNRSIIFLAVKSILSLLALLLLTVVIHEGAHFVTASVLGIPIALFTWFDLNYFAPVFVSGSTEHTTRIMMVSYAGGLVTGVPLLAILVFRRAWFKQSLYRWFLGFYMATFGFWQLCQGILEGAFHDMYIADATNILSISYYIGYASAFLGMAVYWLLMPGLKGLLAKEKYS